MKLFKRIARVTTSKITDDGVAFTDNQTVIEDLRMQFTITKDLDSKPNKCDVMITNLAKHTRKEFQEKPLAVRLDAGYDGVARRLFEGDLRYGWSKLDGADWITTLQLGDGERASRYARINRSYVAGTSILTIVQDAAKTMSLTIPDSIQAILSNVQVPAGAALTGNAGEELTRALAPYGYSWSIQNGKLQVLRDEDIVQQRIIVSQDTGMIGSPEFGTPDAKGKPPKLSIRMLLYPELLPGGLVEVHGRDINGTFKVLQVAHKGDTHGDDWVSEIQCRQYNDSDDQ